MSHVARQNILKSSKKKSKNDNVNLVYCKTEEQNLRTFCQRVSKSMFPLMRKKDYCLQQKWQGEMIISAIFAAGLRLSCKYYSFTAISGEMVLHLSFLKKYLQLYSFTATFPALKISTIRRNGIVP